MRWLRLFGSPSSDASTANIIIGESLKNLDKITEGNLLPQYPQVDWKKAKGLRDIISHHYFDIDAEEIFHLCAAHIEPMRNTIRQNHKGCILKALRCDFSDWPMTFFHDT
jgi:uncharacterized protein with HEPN domain